MFFNGFDQNDFQTFSIEGLDERMDAIRERIQPKFKQIGEALSSDVAALAGNEMFLHIAKHARRKVNPPNDTWMAICHDKRGYKKHPHFQVGLFDDHVFIWLAFIYELPNKSNIAKTFLEQMDDIQETIPNDFVISLDHTKKIAHSLENISSNDFKKMLERFRDVKKAEFLVGKHILADDPLLKDGEQFIRFTKETFDTLMPLYKMSMK